MWIVNLQFFFPFFFLVMDISSGRTLTFHSHPHFANGFLTCLARSDSESLISPVQIGKIYNGLSSCSMSEKIITQIDGIEFSRVAVACLMSVNNEIDVGQ